MAQVFGIETHLERLDQIAPNGFFFGLHIRHTLPLFTHQTYPSLWVNHYIREAYALRDPIIAWGLDRVGTCRWSEIDIPDPFNILGQAQEFGMNFGIAVSFGSLNSRTIATASRPDREFTDTEIASFADVIDALHTIYQPPRVLNGRPNRGPAADCRGGSLCCGCCKTRNFSKRIQSAVDRRPFEPSGPHYGRGHPESEGLQAALTSFSGCGCRVV